MQAQPGETLPARRVEWIGAQDNDWSNQYNWRIAGTSTNVVPVATDDVYINGSVSHVDITNVGYGLSTLYGLHIIGNYSGTLTLANALSVGTYEQTSGTLAQWETVNVYDLTITDVMLWSGGTLGELDDGSAVILDGAAGRFASGDNMLYIASTLNVLADSTVTMISGELEFQGGMGLFLDGKMISLPAAIEADPERSEVIITGKIGFDGRIHITSNGTFEARRKVDKVGGVKTIPILNEGKLLVKNGIRLTTQGRLGGATGPSLSQTGNSAYLEIQGGGAIWLEEGHMSVAAGKLLADIMRARIDETPVPVVIKGILKVSGGVVKFDGPDQRGIRGILKIEGNVDWTAGTYEPTFKENNQARASLWSASGSFTIGANAKIEPSPFGIGGAQDDWVWMILVGEKGITGSEANRLIEDYATGWDIKVTTFRGEKTWWLHKQKSNDDA